MPNDPESDVRILGTPLPYADGAEERVLSVLREAHDVSTASDELAAQISDWPTRYHFSRQRAHLLRPLNLGAGNRVLDVGAGTGVMSRFLGEQGAEVVALEGSLPRARAAAARCRDLPSVEVVCGALDEFEDDDGFDVVLVIGVLEYAGHLFGGGSGPERFLSRIRQLTRPGGSLVLAIENQLGLKYLLGYAEDHHGLPWVGIEGYPGPSGIRTFSRRQLHALLASEGFPHQRWLYPAPDYKLPSVVLSDAAFDLPDAPQFVDQLVRTPVRDEAFPRTLFCDDREAARTLLEAGIGRDVANSFLVVASSHESQLGERVPRDVVAWHFGGERMRPWMRGKVIMAGTADRRFASTWLDADTSTHQRGWLRQRAAAEGAYELGPTLERLLLDACRRGDVEEVQRVLGTWRSHLAGLTKPLEPASQAAPNPFVHEGSTHLLPPEYLDVELANFVVHDDGSVTYVDSEWEALGGVDFDLVCTRALWYLAHRLVHSGAPFPWPASTTVDELTVTLGSLCEMAITAELLARWRHAEDLLQEIVAAIPAEVGGPRRVEAGRHAQTAPPVLVTLPLTRLRAEVARAEQERAHVEAARHQLEEFERRGEHIKALEADRFELTRRVEAHQRIIEELAGVREQFAHVSAAADAAHALAEARGLEIEAWKARWTRIERLWPTRFVRFVTRRPFRG